MCQGGILENDNGTVNRYICIFSVLFFPLSADLTNSTTNGWGGRGMQKVERPFAVCTVHAPFNCLTVPWPGLCKE